MIRPLYVLVLTFEILYRSASKNGFKSCEFDHRCACKRDQSSSLYVADCSRLNMTRIQRFPNVLLKLSLRMNSLEVIKDGIFSENTLLTSLDLSFNNINSISSSSFIGLEKLKELDLQHNNLRKISFTHQWLARFKSLVYLNLKENFYDEYQPDISSLVRLETLKMDFVHNKTAILSKQFKKLKRLKLLDFSGFTGHCSVPVLTPNTFQNVPYVRHLNLSMCKIKSLQIKTFHVMKNIASLDLSGNTCLKFQVLENVTADLQFSAIKILKVNKIHKVFDMNTYLHTNHIKHLKNTSILELHMDSNRLQQIEPGALRFLPTTLIHLSVRDNMFSLGPYVNDLLALSVKTVDVSGMNSFHKEDSNPEKCNLDLVCTWHTDVRLDEYLDPQFKHVWFRGGTTEQGGFGRTLIPIPYNLTKLNYRSCGSQYNITEVELSNNKLESVDLSNNLLTRWIGPLRNVKKLRYLDLSSNMCSYLSTFFFGPDFIVLEKLSMSNNLLGLILPSDIDGNTFQHLLNVIKLDLSQNRISNLPHQIFKSQIKMEFLDLSDNFIENIDFQLSHLIKLSYLNLRNNLITFINNQAIIQINSLVDKRKNLTINLSRNKLICTCESQKFIDWMGSTSVHIVNKTHYFCQLSTGKRVQMKHIPELFTTLEKECTSYVILTSGLLVSLSLFIIVLIMGVCYRFRWKLRYCYYMVKIRSRSKIPQIDEDENEYMYDVFVSYADDDRSFVHTQLLQTLEKENGIRLCLHKRNFLPGNDIATNITSAIHNSHKTVVIMTYHYLKSYWCMFEFNMARMESIYERNNENVLFLVVFEQISARDFPLHILEVVQSQSYIEFPNDEQGDVVFWRQLVTALK
ncbi:toll-like receptor 4 [Mytilus edulis]|uniref:toll-like receptor 4 n=1 Tax=Mytilus edulis TaxID=6550 RepID=UPI0039EF789C